MDKQDLILEHLLEIKQDIAKQCVHNENFQKRLNDVEGVTGQYKSDRAGIMGASVVLSAVAGFFSALFGRG